MCKSPQGQVPFKFLSHHMVLGDVNAVVKTCLDPTQKFKVVLFQIQ